MKTTKRIAPYVGVGILLTILLFAACNNQTKLSTTSTISVVKPAFKGMDVVASNFIIDPSVSDTITTTSGSKIIIPANSLLDADGNPIKEPCVISYREFMNPADIMLSGIPMSFKSKDANINKNFTSAGMFELNGKTQSGKEVTISNSNPLSVQLASNISTQGYSNFYLNQQTGEWIYTGEEQMIENLDKINLNEQIEKLKKTSVFAGKNYFVMSTSAMLDIYYNEDRNKIYRYYEQPKPRLPKRLLQYGVTSSELYCWNNAMLNKKEEAASFIVWENISGKSFPKWTKGNYATVTNISGNTHQLTIAAEGQDTFKTKIKSVMRIKHLFAFSPEHWTNSYDDAMAKIKTEEQRLAAMADVFRTLEVNQFGIYNCDKFYSVPEAFVVKANFIFPAGNETFKPEKIYYVSIRDKSLITYKYDELTEITLCKDPSAVLVTVLNGNMLAEVSANAMVNINSNKNVKEQRTFIFKEKMKINSQDDIRNYFKNININT
ncbi:MAG TPA: hypothetical protein VGF30_14225 [Bacteroidia bacterium]